eukprot:2669685-Prorocentrum_lima.AAC.1
MTSSLVGSEMCIRDRVRPLGDVTSVAGKTRFSKTRKHDAQRSNRPGSVSYTHLTLPTICSV